MARRGGGEEVVGKKRSCVQTRHRGERGNAKARTLPQSALCLTRTFRLHTWACTVSGFQEKLLQCGLSNNHHLLQRSLTCCFPLPCKIVQGKSYTGFFPDVSKTLFDACTLLYRRDERENWGHSSAKNTERTSDPFQSKPLYQVFHYPSLVKMAHDERVVFFFDIDNCVSQRTSRSTSYVLTNSYIALS